MRLTMLGFTFAAAIAWSTVANAAPTTFDFSYRFASGDLVTGSFTGTADGNLITGLTDISAFINGVPFAGNGNLVNLGWVYIGQYPGNPGTAVASFDGTQNALGFYELSQDKFFESYPYFGGLTSYALFVNGATFVWEGEGCGCSTAPYVPANWAVYARADGDNDGVPDTGDQCENTVIPESVPTSGTLGQGRYALTQPDSFIFAQGPKTKGTYDTTDTAGCSCEQIVAALGLGSGQTRYGCSKSVMEAWISGQP